MNNLTAREKGFMYVITLVIIVVLGYFFGIRTLNKKYDEYKLELQAAQERQAYLDQLIANNATMSQEIEELKEKSQILELSFLDKIETECISQYILKTFEEEGCPYNFELATSDVPMASVTGADGSASADSVSCLQVDVSYSTTDGVLPTQYNRTPDLTDNPETREAFGFDPNVRNSPGVFESQYKLDLEKQANGEFAERKGYAEFISALKKINSADPGCVKVTSYAATSENGILVLNASICFYATSLEERLSTDTSKAPYSYWTGHTNVDTEGGIIGFPYVVDDENSLWFGSSSADFDPESADFQFAPYWAVVWFRSNYDTNGEDIYKTIGWNDGAPEDKEAAEGGDKDAVPAA